MSEVLAKSYIRIFLAIIGASTLMLGAAYTMVQQSTRLSANDQPEAMAQVVKNELESGSSANDVITGQTVNLADNINPFVIITDDTRHVLSSTANLNGKTPLPPKGVFDYTSEHGSDHFTWQPADGVRLATRVISYGNANDSKGFIVTGQSLKPYEDRIGVYGELALAAWLAILAWSFLMLVLPERKFRPKPKSKK
jgi:hypothetical protein